MSLQPVPYFVQRPSQANVIVGTEKEDLPCVRPHVGYAHEGELINGRRRQKAEQRRLENEYIELISTIFGEVIPLSAQATMHNTECFFPVTKQKTQFDLTKKLIIKSRLVDDEQQEVLILQEIKKEISYPNNLETREFSEEESSCSPQDGGASLSESKMGSSVEGKTDSSGCLGVYKAFYLKSPQPGLQGALFTYECPGNAERDAFLREISIRETLQNIAPYILKLIKIDYDKDKKIKGVFSEFCDKESLQSHILDQLHNCSLDSFFYNSFTQLLHCINALHKQGVVLLNLHPSTILVTTEADSSLSIRISDFRAAQSKDFPPVVEEDFSQSPYTSPERMEDPTTVNYASDMWSLGLILLEMMMGRQANAFLNSQQPWIDSYNWIHRLLDATIEKTTDSVQYNCRICKGLLQVHPKDRLTAAAIVEGANTQLPELVIEEPFLCIPKGYQVKTLVERFSQRPWDDSVRGYVYNEVEHAEDLAQLKHLVEVNNILFADKINLCGGNTCTGYLEKIDMDSESEIFARADLHGDVRSVMAQLEAFRSENCLDKNYVCKRGFKQIFLGDFMDRGYNEVEVLLLLLALRIENLKFESIILVRGNHEDVGMQLAWRYSSNITWLSENRTLMEQCYLTFPVAAYVAEKEGRVDKENRKEYVQFSHGMMSLRVDPIGFLENPLAENQDRFCVIPDVPSDVTRLVEMALEEEPSSRLSQAVARVLSAQKEEMKMPGTILSKYTWTDVDDAIQSFAGVICTQDREMALSPGLFHAFSRTGGRGVRVKASTRGHEHIFTEHVVKRKDGVAEKVIITTLAVAITGNGYGAWDGFGQQFLQGLLYKVRPRVRDWQKTPFYIQGEKDETQLVRGLAVGMFDRIAYL